jgi:hypothetical protein
MEIKLHSYDYLINNSFSRIKNNKPFDEKLKPYTIEFIDEMLLYFKTKEEYEKCQFLLDFKEKLNHENGFKKKGA